MLKKLYRWLFHSCDHKWVIIDKIPVHFEGKYYTDEYHLQCEKCGNLKKKRLGS